MGSEAEKERQHVKKFLQTHEGCHGAHALCATLHGQLRLGLCLMIIHASWRCVSIGGF